MNVKMLAEVEKIGDFEIDHINNPDPKIEPKANCSVSVRYDTNEIKFKLKPNGCTVSTIIEAALMMIDGHNEEEKSTLLDIVHLRLEEALILLE